ncbi:MAG: ABC transporter permease [Solirubrobacteraceae bacterium]
MSTNVAETEAEERPVDLRRRDHRWAASLEVLRRWSQRNGLFYAVIGLCVLFAIDRSRFVSTQNIEVILLQVSVVGLVAVPGAMLILCGYVDLSVGSVSVLASMAFGILVQSDHVSSLLGVVFCLMIGTAYGLFQGVAISYFGLSPIVVTLGGLAGVRGLAEYISKGMTQFGFGAGFDELGNGKVAGIPIPVVIAGVAFLVGAYVWYQMPYGKRMAAIGSDKTVANSLGIAVKRIPLVLYVVSGFCSALAGLILTAQLDATSLSIGVNFELQVLTAILLGGVAFVGGRGSLFGVLMGVLFVGVLDNGLVVIGVSPFLSDVAVGAALVCAAALDILYQRLDRVVIEASASPASVAQRPFGSTSRREKNAE